MELPANASLPITQFDDNVAFTQTEQDETLLDVARRFLLGQTEIVRLNPGYPKFFKNICKISGPLTTKVGTPQYGTLKIGKIGATGLLGTG